MNTAPELSLEQIAELIAESQSLVAAPTPWQDFTERQQEVFAWLRGQPTFTALQRMYLHLWWMPVDAEILQSLNDLAPPYSHITGRVDASGNRWVNSDLLTDSVRGGPLAALNEILITLPLVYDALITWPEPVEYDDGENEA